MKLILQSFMKEGMNSGVPIHQCSWVLTALSLAVAMFVKVSYIHALGE